MISFALRRMILGVAGWWHLNAMSTLDLFNGRYMQNRVPLAQASALTFARASTFTTKDAAGLYQEFAANALARSNALGAYIGKAWVNKIRNPRGEGGVVGTVGVTNKCTGYNAAPPALVTPTTLAAFNSAVTGVTVVAGDASTLFGVVDATAALQAVAASDITIAAGLNNAFMNGRVIKIDNSAGAASTYLLPAGTTDGTNSSVSAYIWGTGLYRLTYQSYGPATPDQAIPATPTRAKLQNQPAGSGDKLKIIVAPGAVIYVILWQLEQGATAAPVPTVVAGAAATAQLPTNWAYEDLTTGLKCSFLGVNTEAGVPAADLRISGTSAATTNVMRVRFDQSTNATAAAGQAWGLDFGGKLLSGVSPNVYARMTAFNSSAALSDGASGTSTPLTSSNVQRTAKGVISDGTTNNVRGALYMDVTSGNVYDFTLRVSAAKLVQLAAIEGPELVTNGTFTSDVSGWTATNSGSIAWNAGRLEVTRVVSVGDRGSQALTCVVGKVYKVSVDVADTSPSTATIFIGTSNNSGDIASFLQPNSGTIQTVTGYFVATATTHYISVSQGAAGTRLFDNIFVKAVTPGYMPAFPILPAVGVPGDSTKAADDLTYASMAWFSASGFEAACSRLVVPKWGHNDIGVVRPLFEHSVDASNYILGYINASGYPALKIVSGGVVQTDTPLPYAIAVARAPLLFGWSAAGGYIVDAAGHAVTFGAVSLPTGLTTGRIGSSQAGLYLEDTLEYVETHPLLTQADALILAAAA